MKLNKPQKIVMMGMVGMIAILILTAFLTAFVLNKKGEKYTFKFGSQTVIKQITALNRLETSSFTIEKIIDAGTSGNKLQQFLVGDRLLLIAHGTVIAGFDMSKVKDTDIEVAGQTLTVHMPPPEILVSTLDNDQTRVYDRQSGIFTKGDKDLESEARNEAVGVIKDAACKGGILNEATKNARNQLTVLFKGFGFTTVVLDIPDGSC
jgi:hypothetical protein